MKLTVLLLLLLLKIALHTPLSEGYNVFVEPDYHFGQIMNVYFLYEPSLENKFAVESVLSIKENVTVLHQCTIPPSRGRRIADHPNRLQGFVIPGPFDVFFQIIELPTDLITDFRFTNVSFWRLKLTVETKDGSFFSSRYFNLKESFIDDWLFDTQVLLKSKNQQLENASLLSIQANIPVFERKRWLELKVEPDNATYSYSLEFHRVDRGLQDLCPTDNTVGEIDLAASNNLQSFTPCEVSLNRTLMMVFAHTLPHGLIRVRVLIRETNELVYDMRRYFEIRLPKNEIPFTNITTPYADDLEIPYGIDFIFDASKSFYPSLESSYGTIQDYRPNLRIFTTCTGNLPICQNWTSNTGQPRIEVKWQEVKDDIFGYHSLEFAIFTTYDNGPTLAPSARKTISFHRFGLHVDMICIRNCGQYLAQEVPGIFMAKCYDCGDVDPWDIDYSWKIMGEREPLQLSRYYIIPPSQRTKSSLLLRLIVNCPKTIFTNDRISCRPTGSTAFCGRLRSAGLSQTVYPAGQQAQMFSVANRLNCFLWWVEICRVVSDRISCRPTGSDVFCGGLRSAELSQTVYPAGQQAQLLSVDNRLNSFLWWVEICSVVSDRISCRITGSTPFSGGLRSAGLSQTVYPAGQQAQLLSLANRLNSFLWWVEICSVVSDRISCRPTGSTPFSGGLRSARLSQTVYPAGQQAQLLSLANRLNCFLWWVEICSVVSDRISCRITGSTPFSGGLRSAELSQTVYPAGQQAQLLSLICWVVSDRISCRPTGSTPFSGGFRSAGLSQTVYPAGQQAQLLSLVGLDLLGCLRPYILQANRLNCFVWWVEICWVVLDRISCRITGSTALCGGLRSAGLSQTVYPVGQQAQLLSLVG
ncbi:hypothetical protein RRG08_036807 [Elysia crispata]|uniref:Uncharacterized protein n=1 Tax=Elysia crispata TaxID=231223 RepID=A0AAE1ADJ1_9GAST|nr:hypothetical protein RRG08_036807 [Elysia crispata]